MKFTKDQIYDLLEDEDTIVTDIDDTWRHGTDKTYVSKYKGSYYEYCLRIHHSEGIQLFGEDAEVTAQEVEPVEVVTVEWKRVK